MKWREFILVVVVAAMLLITAQGAAAFVYDDFETSSLNTSQWRIQTPAANTTTEQAHSGAYSLLTESCADVYSVNLNKFIPKNGRTVVSFWVYGNASTFSDSIQPAIVGDGGSFFINAGYPVVNEWGFVNYTISSEVQSTGFSSVAWPTSPAFAWLQIRFLIESPENRLSVKLNETIIIDNTTLPGTGFTGQLLLAPTCGENVFWDDVQAWDYDQYGWNDAEGQIPSFLQNSPLDGEILGSTSPTFTWDGVSAAEFSHYTLYIDDASDFNTPVQSYDVFGITNTTFTVPDTFPTHQIFYWKVAAYDGLGNDTNTSIRQFDIDTSSPDVQIILPNDGVTLHDPFILYTPSAYSVIQNCTLTFGGNETTRLDINHNDTNQFSLSVGAGTYQYNISCTDALGHVGQSATRTVTIDKFLIDRCFNMNVSGTYYLQDTFNYSGFNNGLNPGSCLNVTVSNVVLDGQGNIINNSVSASHYAVRVSSSLTNITVKNFRYKHTGSAGSFIFTSSGATIRNNNLQIERADSTTHAGIFIDSTATGSFIYNNTVNITGSNLGSRGVAIIGRDTVVRNNTILLLLSITSSTGIAVSGTGGQGLVVDNNTIICGNSAIEYQGTAGKPGTMIMNNYLGGVRALVKVGFGTQNFNGTLTGNIINGSITVPTIIAGGFLLIYNNYINVTTLGNAFPAGTRINVTRTAGTRPNGVYGTQIGGNFYRPNSTTCADANKDGFCDSTINYGGLADPSAYSDEFPAPPIAFHLLSPSNGAYFNDTSPIFSWDNTSSSNFSYYTLVIDDNSAFPHPEFSYNLSGVLNTTIHIPDNLTTNIPWYWHVVAVDAYGQRTTSAEDYFFVIDTTIPSIVLLGPEDAENVTTSNVTFTYNVSDEENISVCALILNGNVTGNVTIAQNATNHFYITGLGEDNYSWTVYCIDVANNTGVTTTLTFGIHFCVPAWSCSGFDACSMSNVSACLAVADANLCGEAFNGTLSDYDEACVYVPPCAENWTCSVFNPCNGSVESCVEVTDLNECGTVFAGNLSDYDDPCVIGASNPAKLGGTTGTPKVAVEVPNVTKVTNLTQAVEVPAAPTFWERVTGFFSKLWDIITFWD